VRVYDYRTPPQSVMTGSPTWQSDRVQCLCDSGYHGDDCSIAFETASLCPNSCSGNGVCVMVSALVPQIRTSANNGSVNALKHVGGVDKHRCECDKGYNGLDCSQSDPCPSKCSNHGKCIGGQCECEPFRDGLDCSILIPQCGVHFECLNLGVCDASGQMCDCLPFYEGRDCAHRIKEPQCPDDYVCGEGGKCYEGKCLCRPGSYGFDCEGHYSEEVSPWEPGSRLYYIPRTPEEYRKMVSSQQAP